MTGETTGKGIEDLARRLAESIPAAAAGLRQDLERNFRAILQATLGKLDLNTRSEFEVHTRLLERTRLRLEQLEARVRELEARLGR
ncbi:MAG TPA: accessory factor UbiK family protein [Steroidobacteraceae bacterium]|nr:accessory factor UbiK family protein [Steroidobacteraceae bacterium]